MFALRGPDVSPRPDFFAFGLMWLCRRLAYYERTHVYTLSCDGGIEVLPLVLTVHQEWRACREIAEDLPFPVGFQDAWRDAPEPAPETMDTLATEKEFPPPPRPVHAVLVLALAVAIIAYSWRF